MQRRQCTCRPVPATLIRTTGNTGEAVAWRCRNGTLKVECRLKKVKELSVDSVNSVNVTNTNTTTKTFAATTSTENDEWEEEMVLRHIQECRCTCNHMGYGNYMDTTWDNKHLVVPPPPVKTTNVVLTSPCGYTTTDAIVPLRKGSIVVNSTNDKTPTKTTTTTPCDVATTPDKIPVPVEMIDTTSNGSVTRSCCLACFLLVLVAITGIGVLMPLTARFRQPPSAQDRVALVRSLLQRVPLIVGHNDLAWNVRSFVHNRLSKFNLTSDLRMVSPWSNSPWSQTDLPRLRQGLVGAQVWSAYAPCGGQFRDAVQMALEQVNLLRRLIDLYPQQMKFVATATELEAAHASGLLASMVSLEGGHSLGASLAVLRAFYDLGVRAFALTHNCHTPWADSSTDNTTTSNTENQGVSEFGKVMIRELNRLGGLIDLSHCSERCAMTVLALSRAPVVLSHSCPRALCNHTRNVPDYILRLLAQHGGVIMVSFYNDYLTCSSKATLADVIEHLTYLRDLAGEDHVGIGAGFDGINRTPEGLEDVSKFPSLFSELLATGRWTIRQLEKLAGGNYLRVLRRVEKVKEDSRLMSMEPFEEIIPTRDIKHLDRNGCLTY